MGPKKTSAPKSPSKGTKPDDKSKASGKSSALGVKSKASEKTPDLSNGNVTPVPDDQSNINHPPGNVNEVDPSVFNMTQ